MTIADYVSKDEEIASLKAKLRAEAEFHVNYHKNKINTLSKKLKAANKKCEFYRGKETTTRVSRDKLKATRQSVLKTMINLKLEGLLEISNEQISDRCFVDINHVRNTTAIIKRKLNESNLLKNKEL